MLTHPHRPPAATPTDAQRSQWSPAVVVTLGIVALVLLVMFPVQVLTIAMLVTVAMMVISIYVVWEHSHQLAPARRAVVERRLPLILGAGIAVGIGLVLAAPTTTASVAFALTLITCVTYVALDLSSRHRSHA
jgi:O-antigen/teichoic acid export membrane protein